MLKDRIDSGVDAGTAIRLGAATLGQVVRSTLGLSMGGREFALAMGLEVGQDAEVGWPTGPTPVPPHRPRPPAQLLIVGKYDTVLGAAPIPGRCAHTDHCAAAPVLAWRRSVPTVRPVPAFGPPQPSALGLRVPGPSGPRRRPSPVGGASLSSPHRGMASSCHRGAQRRWKLTSTARRARQLDRHGPTRRWPWYFPTGPCPTTLRASHHTTLQPSPASPPSRATWPKARSPCRGESRTEGVQNCTEDPTAALTPIRAGLAFAKESPAT